MGLFPPNLTPDLLLVIAIFPYLLHIFPELLLGLCPQKCVCVHTHIHTCTQSPFKISLSWPPCVAIIIS